MKQDYQGNTRKIYPIRFPVRIVGLFWRDLAVTLGPILLISVAAIWVALSFVRPAPLARPRRTTPPSRTPGAFPRSLANRAALADAR